MQKNVGPAWTLLYVSNKSFGTMPQIKFHYVFSRTDATYREEHLDIYEASPPLFELMIFFCVF